VSLEAALVMTLTAYTNYDVGMDGLGIMASGLYVFDGACACGEAWPFGTVFYVPSLRRGCICQDRGGAIGDRNLDFWMAEREAALEFGRREAEVLVWPLANRGGESGRGRPFVASGEANHGGDERRQGESPTRQRGSRGPLLR